MINTDNIGKRIRTLRKQKHISQERLAEDLGMYQADISNLERAIGGSGITDLFKLDMIADYFEITLTELLIGSDSENSMPVSESIKSEEYKLQDYILENVLYGSDEDVYVSEVTLVAPDKKRIIYSFSECDDLPRFYNPKDSIFDNLLINRRDPSYEKKLNLNCFLSGEDYIDIFQNIDPSLVDICRYLIFVATEDEQTVGELIQHTKGKMITECRFPIPSREPEDLFFVNYSDLANVYRYRLMVEANLKNPSVYSDIENITKREKAILEKLKAACASEDAYKVWKKDLIDAKVKDVMEKQNIVVCTYLFAGLGEYKEILPEEMVDSFKEWLNLNGSAFFGGSRPATKREIRTYVSQHIADELLGLDSPI